MENIFESNTALYLAVGEFKNILKCEKRLKIKKIRLSHFISMISKKDKHSFKKITERLEKEYKIKINYLKVEKNE